MVECRSGYKWWCVAGPKFSSATASATVRQERFWSEAGYSKPYVEMDVDNPGRKLGVWEAILLPPRSRL